MLLGCRTVAADTDLFVMGEPRGKQATLIEPSLFFFGRRGTVLGRCERWRFTHSLPLPLRGFLGPHGLAHQKISNDQPEKILVLRIDHWNADPVILTPRHEYHAALSAQAMSLARCRRERLAFDTDAVYFYGRVRWAFSIK